MPSRSSVVFERDRESALDRFRFLCPECGSKAFVAGEDLLCPAEGRSLAGRDGVLLLLRRERLAAFAPFLDAYRRVRRTEGWGGGPDYYRGLPFDSEGRHRDVWRLRARSYRRALGAIGRRFPDMKRADECDRVALRVLELGAGNGWLSHRMAEAGHYVLATDVSLDEEDGLGAMRRYALPAPVLGERLTCALAEMEDLPLEDAQFDLVVANGSLHYAARIGSAVVEAFRVLRPGGAFLVLDSPVYEREEHGREMVRRRRERHRILGVIEGGSASGFLLEKEILALASSAGFGVEVERPFEGLPRAIRRALSRLRREAPPARFPLYLLEKR